MENAADAFDKGGGGGGGGGGAGGGKRAGTGEGGQIFESVVRETRFQVRGLNARKVHVSAAAGEGQRSTTLATVTVMEEAVAS